jgi:predicted unusual protein kinase regulating ubiquinone biosynthesis (AarF/ABC1/UbiB family)
MHVIIYNRTRNFVPEKVAHAFNTARAAELKDLLAKSGSVTFIKSGQALSLRQDLIKNAEYVRELTKLQDEVGTFPNAVAMQIIQVADICTLPCSTYSSKAVITVSLQYYCAQVV